MSGPVYICPICKEMCKGGDDIVKEEDNRVACEECDN